jgi:integrase
MAGMAGRRVGRLTARQVQTIRRPGLHGDGGGLYLNVGDGGAKSWIFRHQTNGKVRKYGLGSIITVDLIDARHRAETIRRQLLDGIDPREARRAEQEATAIAEARSISFDKATEAYIESHRAGWKSDKHVGQWQATLSTYASPVFGRLPVSAIDTGMVMRVLQPIWASKNETAHRLRGRIEAVLGWARVHGYRSGENPAQWRNHLDHLLPKRAKVHKVEHHAALPYHQTPDFMRDLRERFGVAPLALEFTILCAVRTSETLNADWNEFDLDDKLWTIPPARMKGGREHRVPLCDRAVAIVREMQTVKSGEFVFPGARRGRPLSNMAMLTTLRRMKRGDLTTHGFRSTFRTWAAERTNHQREVIEAALAHVNGDKTEAAYQRGDLLDKRRRLMDAWAVYCASRAATGNVVALR